MTATQNIEDIASRAIEIIPAKIQGETQRSMARPFRCGVSSVHREPKMQKRRSPQ
ncbi:MAG: hypothetical protein AAGA21_18180 [Pseudomonadota bacterium]